MPKVIFKFDIEKDLFNIWETCNSKFIFGYNFKEGISQRIINLCKRKKFENIKNTLKNYQKKIYSSKLIPQIEKSFNEAWNKVEEEYFKRLEKIMKKPFFCEKITAYLTLVKRCPYNYEKENPLFFVHLFAGIPNALATAGHEIMHIQFHNTYWKQTEKKIGKEKTADLKEALTVLLNLEFQDLWIVPDKGYSPHKELRNFIEKQWENEKDFEVLLNNCVDYFLSIEK